MKPSTVEQLLDRTPQPATARWVVEAWRDEPPGTGEAWASVHDDPDAAKRAARDATVVVGQVSRGWVRLTGQVRNVSPVQSVDTGYWSWEVGRWMQHADPTQWDHGYATTLDDLARSGVLATLGMAEPDTPY